MRKLPKQARSRRLVASLIEATRELILLRGLGSVSTILVARIAGVSQGSLYQYFESREQLLEAVLQEVEKDVDLLAQACIVDALRTSDTSAWIRAAIDRVLVFHTEDDGLRLELAKGWASLPERFRTEAIHRKVAEVIRIARAGEPLRTGRGNPDEGAFTFVNNAVITLATMQREGGSEHAQAAIREALVQMLGAALKRPSGERSTATPV